MECEGNFNFRLNRLKVSFRREKERLEKEKEEREKNRNRVRVKALSNFSYTHLVFENRHVDPRIKRLEGLEKFDPFGSVEEKSLHLFLAAFFAQINVVL